jgi:ABC-type glutathione transport system ATPase component
MKTQPPSFPRGGPDSAHEQAPLLEIVGVTKSFVSAPLFESRRRAVALNNVSLSVRVGRCVGLVGESGSGKSTLARCILGLERPDSGEIRFEGKKLAPGRRARQALAGQIQPVFQNPASSLNPRRRVSEIIAEPLSVHTTLTRSEREAEVRRLLVLVALSEDFASRYPGQLSGGQCQRVSIARALALRPKLIIADEPTSSLDVLVQEQIVKLLSRIGAEFGIAMLFVSHNLAVTRELCDEMAVLYAGEIVEFGPSEQVVSAPSHPYTKTLIRSVPTLTVPDEEPAAPAAGA